MSEVSGRINIARLPEAPSIAELADLGVARVSWGPLLQWNAIARFQEELASLD
jgi:2-methylisocitrate lyase-like PEP mutase family enzyme